MEGHDSLQALLLVLLTNAFPISTILFLIGCDCDFHELFVLGVAEGLLVLIILFLQS
jgi:hypothetical protein